MVPRKMGKVSFLLAACGDAARALKPGDGKNWRRRLKRSLKRKCKIFFKKQIEI